jgi:cytochrome c-type biogenesis protein CcmH
VLVASLALFMIAISAGAYMFVGHPYLAARTLHLDMHDERGLASLLAREMRQRPNDPTGWFLLGREYLRLDDAQDAAASFKRAIPLVPPAERPAMLSAYGEALSIAAQGDVTPEAEAAFQASLAGDPKDVKARFYLGQAYAERRDPAHALALWQSLLADTPANTPLHGLLLDRIAILSGMTRAQPNIAQMVAGLADRLKQAPNDPDGWQRLVKSYVVLGDTDKARAALADARHVFAGNRAELAALTAEARDLKLEK